MKPTIYLTGANGFIGTKLSEALGSYNVIPVGHNEIKRMRYVDFHTYFYLSAYGNHYTQKDIYQTYKANVHNLFHTLTEIQKVHFKNFIHISTSSVGIGEQTMYSVTKHCAELLVHQMAKETKRRMFSVRPFSIFGEGESEARFIPVMTKKLSAGEAPPLVPSPIHDWIYVQDFIDALLWIMHHPVSIEKPIEVGYGEPRTNLQVFNAIADLLGKEPKYQDMDSLRSYDNDSWFKKVWDVLEESGWKPMFGYKEGLKRTVKYYAK